MYAHTHKTIYTEMNRHTFSWIHTPGDGCFHIQTRCPQKNVYKYIVTHASLKQIHIYMDTYLLLEGHTETCS